MRALLGALFSVAMLLSAAPAVAADSACAKPGTDPSLVGSHWVGKTEWDDGETRAVTMVLRPDCVAEYSYAGTTYTNGRWLQRGTMLLWDTNDHFAQYVGHLRSDQLAGVMYNQRGDTGVWSFRRAD